MGAYSNRVPPSVSWSNVLRSRRNKLVTFASLAVLAATVATLGSPHQGGASDRATAAKKRPNFVVLMTDDQTVRDLRTMTKTRRLISRKGVRFKRSYVSYSLCCPSRASYLTGRYPHNHHVMGLWPPTGGYGKLDKRHTIATYLHDAGYYTGHIGKFLNGYGSDAPADVPPGWDDWHGAVDPTTYRMWGYKLNDNGTIHRYGSPFVKDPALYQTDVYADKAAGFIDQRAQGDKPFFLSVAFLAPHHEEAAVRSKTGVLVRPAPRDRHAFANAKVPITPNYNERHLSDKPAFLRHRSPLINAAEKEQIRKRRVARLASLQAVDDAVSRIVGTLSARGMLANTYIVFTSDNGYFQGEHRVRSGKMLPYEPSTQVPLVIRGPQLAKNRTSGELVSSEDIAPTLLDAAGVRPKQFVDGRSLVPFARRPKRLTNRYLLHETGGRKPVAPTTDTGQETGPYQPTYRRILTYRAVRTRRYLWVRYHSGSRELYDLKHDPWELRSRDRDPRYAKVRRALQRELDRLKRCRGRACRRPGRPIPDPSG